ncbi:hypothetical protein BC830DRAFT_1127910, partial [Chytriomyces sp. MP71]
MEVKGGASDIAGGSATESPSPITSAVSSGGTGAGPSSVTRPPLFGRPVPCEFCRLKRVKCDTQRPSCSFCINRGQRCVYGTRKTVYAKRVLTRSANGGSRSPPTAGASSGETASKTRAQRGTNPCVGCRSHKKKCDNKAPTCSYCTQRGISCEYESSRSNTTQAARLPPAAEYPHRPPAHRQQQQQPMHQQQKPSPRRHHRRVHPAIFHSRPSHTPPSTTITGVRRHHLEAQIPSNANKITLPPIHAVSARPTLALPTLAIADPAFAPSVPHSAPVYSALVYPAPVYSAPV